MFRKVQPSATENSDAQAECAAPQRRLDVILLKNTVTSQNVTLLNATILGVLLFGSTHSTSLSLWYAGLICLTAVRIGYSLHLLNRDLELREPQRWRLDVLAMIAGILWGVPPYLVLQGAPAYSHELIIFMVAGMTAGAALSLAPRIRSVTAFNLPALVTLGSYYVYTGGAQEHVMCGVMVLYFIATRVLAKRSNQVLQNSIANQIMAQTRQQELDNKEHALRSEIKRRKAKEAEFKRALEKSRQLNREREIMFEAMLNPQIEGEKDLSAEFVERMSATLEVERVSIWLFTEDRSAIECYSLFDSRTGFDETPLKLLVEDFPAYFKAVESSLVIDAPDVRSDPRTSEFNDSYLIPLDIHSMLDAPICFGTEVRGVICCESVGNKHVWSPEEVAFVATGAQFIGMKMLADDQSAMAAELQTALREAQRASATKSRFLANMSHEIRTPMNGVLGAATALKDTRLDDAQQQLVEIVQGSGDALMNVLNDILDFSKIEADQVQIERSAFSLRSVIQKVAAVHVLKACECGLAFDVTVADGLADGRIGDAHRLGQILHNLVSNSIKFTEAGTVGISVDADPADPDQLIFSVKDTGVGMTLEESSRIFDQFAQADSSTTRKYGGTGLGLSIVKGLVEIMAGKLEVDSTKGEGTEFRVRLIIPQTEISVADTEPLEQVTADMLPRRVLIAEDNETNQLVIEALLKNFEMELTCVENGAEAVDAFRTGQFDVILMDVQMPVMDGEQALCEIVRITEEEQRSPIPVIAVTANAMTHQIEHYRKIGFSAHVSKPVHRHVLLDTLKKTWASGKGEIERAESRA